MHAIIQSLIIDMLKKAKIWAIREPQNTFHGLVPADILKEYCDQHSINPFLPQYLFGTYFSKFYNLTTRNLILTILSAPKSSL